jgi:hypothetical protein
VPDADHRKPDCGCEPSRHATHATRLLPRTHASWPAKGFLGS